MKYVQPWLIPNERTVAYNVEYILEVWSRIPICAEFITSHINDRGWSTLDTDTPLTPQVTFCMQIIYVLLLSAVKASMLCFFLRIFVTPYVQKASKIGLAIVGLWTIAYLCACIFLCNPVEGQWTGIGKCGTYMTMIQSLIA